MYLDHSMQLLLTHMHDSQYLTRNQVSVIKTKNAFQMCQNAEKGSGESLAYSIFLQIKIRTETLLLVYPPPFFSLIQTLMQLFSLFIYKYDIHWLITE